MVESTAVRLVHNNCRSEVGTRRWRGLGQATMVGLNRELMWRRCAQARPRTAALLSDSLKHVRQNHQDCGGQDVKAAVRPLLSSLSVHTCARRSPVSVPAGTSKAIRTEGLKNGLCCSVVARFER